MKIKITNKHNTQICGSHATISRFSSLFRSHYSLLCQKPFTCFVLFSAFHVEIHFKSLLFFGTIRFNFFFPRLFRFKQTEDIFHIDIQKKTNTLHIIQMKRCVNCTEIVRDGHFVYICLRILNGPLNYSL